jgi:very-short-patch-repair endonuclease
VANPTNLRRGTCILSIPSEFGSNSGSLPEFGEGWGGVRSVGSAEDSPLNPPAHGGTLSGHFAHGGTPDLMGVGVKSILIEELRPGDRVIGHDLQLHPILRIIQKPYQGTMIGIRHRQSEQILWVTVEQRILCQKRNLSYGGNNSWKHIRVQHFGRSRELRNNQTPAEQKLWQAIRGEKLGVKFRRQHPLGRYILDFYAHSKGCVIELDGDSHDSPEAQAYDAVRDTYLRGVGLNVLRFRNRDVYTNLEAVLTQIQCTLAQTEPSDRHQQEWRRVDSLEVGDAVFFGIYQLPVEITALETEVTADIVYGLEIADTNSLVTAVCTIHS